MGLLNINNGIEQKTNIVVTVQCLVYNHEKYLRDTLDGFVMQETTFPFEALVHDDCSTDGSQAIIREYAEKYPDIIKPIFEKENLYSKDIRLIGEIMHSRTNGKYIAFCEGDDFWTDSYKLKKQYDMLEAHPECSMSTHKVLCCDLEKNDLGTGFPQPWYNLDGTQILGGNRLAEAVIAGGYPFHTSSYFIRREVSNVPIHNCYDIGVLRKAVVCGSIYYIDEAMSMRRMGVSGSYNDRLKKGGAKALMDSDRRLLEADMEFDRLTAGKYHAYVLKKRWERICDITIRTKKVNMLKKYSKRFDFNLYRDRKAVLLGEGMKKRLAYYLFMVSPSMAVGVGRLKRKMKTNGGNRK